jgi:hypothetical protein
MTDSIRLESHQIMQEIMSYQVTVFGLVSLCLLLNGPRCFTTTIDHSLESSRLNNTQGHETAKKQKKKVFFPEGQL